MQDEGTHSGLRNSVDPLASVEAVLAVEDRFTQGTVVGGRYRIERKLARGGTSCLFLATQVPLDKKVAVKVLSARSPDSDLERRFRLEAATCARLVHPHIVALHDYGKTDTGDLYMVLEYVDGESLTSLIRRSGALRPALVCKLSHQIACALRCAHSKDVVHRDIKTSNVMVTRDGDREGSEFTKVLDFGIAKLYSGHLDEGDVAGQTRPGTIVGTPRFMAPEQIRSQPVDFRTDIYGLGAMIFTMLTGRPPFCGKGLVEVMNQHLSERPPSLKDLVPVDYLPVFDTIVQSCLEKDPNDRYASMDELLQDLEAAYRLLRAQGGANSKYDHELEDEKVRWTQSQADRTSSSGPLREVSGVGRAPSGLGLAAHLAKARSESSTPGVGATKVPPFAPVREGSAGAPLAEDFVHATNWPERPTTPSSGPGAGTPSARVSSTSVTATDLSEADRSHSGQEKLTTDEGAQVGRSPRKRILVAVAISLGLAVALGLWLTDTSPEPGSARSPRKILPETTAREPATEAPSPAPQPAGVPKPAAPAAAEAAAPPAAEPAAKEPAAEPAPAPAVVASPPQPAPAPPKAAAPKPKPRQAARPPAPKPRPVEAEKTAPRPSPPAEAEPRAGAPEPPPKQPVQHKVRGSRVLEDQALTVPDQAATIEDD